LTPPAAGSTTPRIGITVSPTGERLSLPFPVTIVPQQIVGGPSAGLMFSLAVFDALTPEDLTAGHRIAGTGTIDLNGNVGTIGGVQQKVAAAERAGAQYFLCPPGNYEQARAAARHIQVVRVATVQQAVAFLRTLAPSK
jgi:PDZ domain-containing protein